LAIICFLVFFLSSVLRRTASDYTLVIISEIINSVYLKVKEKLEEQTTQWKKNDNKTKRNKRKHYTEEQKIKDK
jgi:hypothetical protein